MTHDTHRVDEKRGLGDTEVDSLIRSGNPVAPVVQVVNLEFYLFESWVRAPGGSNFDFICKNKNKKGFNC